MPDIMVFASEAAAAVGMNRFQAPAVVLEKVWRRYEFGRPYQAALARTALEQQVEVQTLGSVEDRLDTLIQQSPELKRQVQTLTDAVKQKACSTVERSVNAKLKTHVTQFDPPTRKALVKHVRQRVRQAYGTYRETASIQTIEQQTSAKVQHNNAKFYKTQVGVVGTPPCLTVKVGGRIDGLVNGVLREIKNRRGKFPDVLPLYDVVQVHCYMKLLQADARCSDLPTLATVSEHRKSRGQTWSRDTTVAWDETLWQTVVEGLKRFARVFLLLLQDPQAQADMLLASSDQAKQMIYHKLVAQLDL